MGESGGLFLDPSNVILTRGSIPIVILYYNDVINGHVHMYVICLLVGLVSGLELKRLNTLPPTLLLLAVVMLLLLYSIGI
jgi:hypothetical protein